MLTKRQRCDGDVHRKKSCRRTRASAEDLSSINDGLVCSMCDSPIPYLSDYVRLNPCGCSVCFKCLINAHAERGKERLICCDLPVVSHRFMGAERVPQGAEVASGNHEDRMSEGEIAQLPFDRPFDSLLRDRFPTMQRNPSDGKIAVLHCSILSKAEGK